MWAGLALSVEERKIKAFCAITASTVVSQISRYLCKKSLILAGLEPAIPCFVVRCLIHWATGPQVTVPPLHYYQPLAIRQNLDYVSKSLRNMAKLPGQFF